MDGQETDLNNPSLWKIGQPLLATGVCLLYQALLKKPNGKSYIARAISLKDLSRYNLQETIDYNEAILTDFSDFKFPNHFHAIVASWQNSQYQIIIMEKYKKTLNQQIKSRYILQQQALKIFDQLLKAICSLYLDGYYHRNLRPEHFVQVNGTWKLATLVKQTKNQEVKCEYLWDKEFQAPEAYDKQTIQDQEADDMIVWNMGAILLSLLISNHKLKNLKSIKAFRDKPMISKGNDHSKKLEQILFKMLQYSPKNRMTVDELFSNDFLSPQVAKIYQANRNIRTSKSVIRGSNRMLISNNLKSQLYKKPAQPQDPKLLYQKSKFIVTNELSSQYSPINNCLKQCRCQYEKCKLMIQACQKGCQFFKGSSTLRERQNMFAVRLVSLMFMHQLTENLNMQNNFINAEQKNWLQFVKSKQFEALKIVCNQTEKQYGEQLRKLYKLLEKEEIINEEAKDLLSKYKKRISFQDIKKSYRKILNLTYREIATQFNKLSTPELCRQAMYMTYCISIEKTYPNLQQPFQPFFEWLGPSHIPNYLQSDQFHKYIQESDYKNIIKHALMIWNKYYKI